MNKLLQYARAKKDPAMAMVLEMERIESELEAKIMAKVNAQFNPTILQEALKGMRGVDAKTLVRGVDYFTEEDIQSMIAHIESRIQIPVPENGKDADEDSIIENVLKRIVIPEPREPKDGITLQAGVDYPTEEQIKALISTEIAYLFSIKPKESTGITKDEVNQLIGKIQQKIDWKENAKEIARALETLKGREALDYNALKNTPDIPTEQGIENRVRGILRGGGDRVRVYEMVGNGTSTYTVPLHKRALMLLGTDFPIIYKSTVDFTTSKTTLTITGAVPAPTVGATLTFLYVE